SETNTQRLCGGFQTVWMVVNQGRQAGCHVSKTLSPQLTTNFVVQGVPQLVKWLNLFGLNLVCQKHMVSTRALNDIRDFAFVECKDCLIKRRRHGAWRQPAHSPASTRRAGIL